MLFFVISLLVSSPVVAAIGDSSNCEVIDFVAWRPQ